MEATVLVWDQLESNTVEWVFRVNGDGYVETVVDGMVMDTFYELGEVSDMVGLIGNVYKIIHYWKLRCNAIIVK